MNGITRGGPIVIVGGGVIGTSIAFHLAKRGYMDVTIAGRHLIGEGTTARHRQSPAIGRAVTAWLLDGAPDLDLTALRPGRIGDPAAGREQFVF